MSNLLTALASVSNGFIVPIRKCGKININAHGYDVHEDVDEKWYITSKDGVFVITNINDYHVCNINTTMHLSEALKVNDIFGKPMAIEKPKACINDNEISFIEFLNIANHKDSDANKLLVGFIMNDVMYTYKYSLCVYDINTGKERDIRDENIPVSLLSEMGNIVYINDREIHSLDELDFKMLKVYGMC